MAELAHKRRTKSDPKLLLGVGEFQRHEEALHWLQFSFLNEGSILYPELVNDLVQIAGVYQEAYQSWRKQQTNSELLTEPRWPLQLGDYFPALSIGDDCPSEHRTLRKALYEWAKKWDLLDKTENVHAWVLDILWVTFFAWMADPDRPKAFHTRFLNTGGFRTEFQPYNPVDETLAVAQERLRAESQRSVEQAISQGYVRTTSIDPEHLTWAIRRHLGHLSYEQIGDHYNRDARTVQNRVTQLLREMSLARRPGRPRKKNSHE